MKKLNKEGFSLVELLIAISITSFMTLAIIGLLGYGSRNMSLTQAKVALQNQAKDAVNHIAAYVQEASDVEWPDGTGTPTEAKTDKDALVITKTTVNNSPMNTPDPVTKELKPSETSTWYYYWHEGDCIYFISHEDLAKEQGKTEAELVHPVALNGSKKRILAENVKDFQCEVKKDPVTERKVVHVTLTMEDDVSSYVCEKDIFMRNQ